MGLSIMCVSWDQPDLAMKAWRYLAGWGFEKVEVLSVSDMVQKLLARTRQGQKIRQLWIVGHGHRTGQFIGADPLTLATVEAHRSELARLRPIFTPDAMLTLCGCHVAYAYRLQVTLVEILGIAVRAFTGEQYGILPGFEGRESIVRPLRRPEAAQARP